MSNSRYSPTLSSPYEAGQWRKVFGSTFADMTAAGGIQYHRSTSILGTLRSLEHDFGNEASKIFAIRSILNAEMQHPSGLTEWAHFQKFIDWASQTFDRDAKGGDIGISVPDDHKAANWYTSRSRTGKVFEYALQPPPVEYALQPHKESSSRSQFPAGYAETNRSTAAPTSSTSLTRIRPANSDVANSLNSAASLPPTTFNPPTGARTALKEQFSNLLLEQRPPKQDNGRRDNEDSGTESDNEPDKKSDGGNTDNSSSFMPTK